MEVISSIYNSGYNIKKFYLGSRELNLAYLGNQVIYDEAIGDNDLNYILYEFYGSDTLPNTVEAPVKRAILKGNTLVNLFEFTEPITVMTDRVRLFSSDNFKNNLLNGTYTIINTSNKKIALDINNKSTGVWEKTVTLLGGQKTSVVFDNAYIRMASFSFSEGWSNDNLEEIKCSLVVLNGEHTNIDIPYFEGMQSVKMPGLITTGKNLIGRYEKIVYRSGRAQDGATLDNDGNFTFVGAAGNRPCLVYKINPNTDITVSSNISLKYMDIYEYSDIPNFTRENEPNMIKEYNYIGNQKIITRTTSEGAKYIGISFYNDSNTTGYTNLQLEYGSQATVHESYKSNILTVNEPIELRGIGDVKDELNLLTGEVTQRIRKIVLDGSQNMDADGQGIFIQVDDMKKVEDYRTIITCDKLPVFYHQWDLPNVENGITGYHDEENKYPSQNWLYIKINNSIDVDEVRQILTQNPITIQYELSVESIKTVDLTIVDQDGKTINKLNSFNGTTHVSTDVAENSAYPMVSLEVASELQAAMSKVTEDIELIKPVQNDIETTIDTQSNDIDSLLLATTELFEMFL